MTNANTQLQTIVTKVARMGNTDHDWFGHTLFGDFLGKHGIATLVTSAVTGRVLTPSEQTTCDAVAIALCLSDARIWPLKLTRIAASYGNAIVGMSTGMASLDNPTIGPWSVQRTAVFLQEVMNAVGKDNVDNYERIRSVVLQQIEGVKRIPGFGVALREVDERVVALRKWANETGRDQLPFWKLATTVAGIVYEQCGVRENAGMAVATLLSDLGLAPVQCGWMLTMLMLPTLSATSLEGSELRSPQLVELPQTCFRYVGKARRVSPKKLQSTR